MSEEFELVMSPLCQEIYHHGEAISVEIFSDGEGGWILELVNEQNTSTVWDEPFATDQAALDEVHRMITSKEIVEVLSGTQQAAE